MVVQLALAPTTTAVAYKVAVLVVMSDWQVENLAENLAT